jgi:hypothetical protein
MGIEPTSQVLRRLTCFQDKLLVHSVTLQITQYVNEQLIFCTQGGIRTLKIQLLRLTRIPVPPPGLIKSKNPNLIRIRALSYSNFILYTQLILYPYPYHVLPCFGSYENENEFASHNISAHCLISVNATLKFRCMF